MLEILNNFEVLIENVYGIVEAISFMKKNIIHNSWKSYFMLILSLSREISCINKLVFLVMHQARA